MIPLIIIRPQPGCGATVAAAKALGLEAPVLRAYLLAGQWLGLLANGH